MRLGHKRSVLAAVVAGECALAVFLGWRLCALWPRRRNVPGAAQVVRLDRSGYVFPPVGSFRHYYEPKPDTVVNDAPAWLGHAVSYTINHDTLNERFDYPAEKPPGAFRIITLGDSFTFGQFVDTSRNYSERLEDLLNTEAPCRARTPFEVINLGVGGYDIGYAVQRFSLRGVKYHPDLVIWLINPHNLWQVRDRGASPEFGNKAVLRQQAAYLDAFSKAYGGPLIIVANRVMDDPALREVLRRFVRSRPRTWEFDGLSDLAGIHGTFPDLHPNAYGHSVIAAQLFAYLKTSSVFPCK